MLKNPRALAVLIYEFKNNNPFHSFKSPLWIPKYFCSCSLRAKLPGTLGGGFYSPLPLYGWGHRSSKRKTDLAKRSGSGPPSSEFGDLRAHSDSLEKPGWDPVPHDGGAWPGWMCKLKLKCSQVLACYSSFVLVWSSFLRQINPRQEPHGKKESCVPRGSTTTTP